MINFNQSFSTIFASLITDFNKVFIDNSGYKMMWQGFQNTLIITFFGVLIGMFIGVSVGIIKVIPKEKSSVKILNKLADIYLTIVRGTPVTVQLLLMAFVFLSPLRLPEIIVAILVFGINSGAYSAELFRSGIQSIEKGQMEAGRALGLSYSKTMIKIILPQAIKNVLPALGNEFIALLKETSVVGMISVIDLTEAASKLASKHYLYYVPYLTLALVYLALVMIITMCVKLLERRLNNDKR